MYNLTKERVIKFGCGCITHYRKWELRSTDLRDEKIYGGFRHLDPKRICTKHRDSFYDNLSA